MCGSTCLIPLHTNTYTYYPFHTRVSYMEFCILREVPANYSMQVILQKPIYTSSIHICSIVDTQLFVTLNIHKQLTFLTFHQFLLGHRYMYIPSISHKGGHAWNSAFCEKFLHTCIHIAYKFTQVDTQKVNRLCHFTFTNIFDISSILCA